MEKSGVVAAYNNDGKDEPQQPSFLGGVLGSSNVERAEIEFADLTMVLDKGKKHKKKLIMDGLSGVVRSGKLTALMGPSGSGKTS
jgi:ABC-type glutathione transport system ATPase component